MLPNMGGKHKAFMGGKRAFSQFGMGGRTHIIMGGNVFSLWAAIRHCDEKKGYPRSGRQHENALDLIV